MKNIILITLTVFSLGAAAQNFDNNLASAKSSYASGDLENARFTMQQMITDLDIQIGKEVLKALPAKMETLTANTTSDNVTANTGFAGVVVTRDYGTESKNCNINIMSNSPMIASVNALLALPFVGNSTDGTQKVVKIQGYKAMLQKSVDSETNKTDYTLQLPLNSTLLTLTAPDSNEAEVLKMANLIPVQQIVKMVQ